MANKSYDLIVLGTGTGGGIVARMCAKQGWKVLNIENRSPGGTCAQRGCDAKKPFVEAAAVIDQARRLQGKGIVGTINLDWADLVNFKNTFTEPVPEKERRDLAEEGMALIEGEPFFADAHRIEVNGETYEAKKIVIATGMVPRPLQIEGADLVTTSDALLDLAALPERLSFIGAGYVSMEFAHVAARLKRQIHLFQGPDRALGAFDQDLVQMLIKASRSLGMRFHFNSPVEKIERTSSGLRVVAAGQTLTQDSDLVVHGAGRVPSTMNLRVENADVTVRKDGGIAVNEYLQSLSNPDVYAVGDCAASAGKPLTPVANLEAVAAAKNLLGGNRFKPDYRGIASVVFSTPQLAMSGLTEEAAGNQGIDADIRFENLASHKTMRQLGISAAAGKVLLEKGSGRILGAHFLGPAAADMANCAALAIRNHLTGKQLADTLYAYPTLTGMIGSLVKP